MKIIDKQLLNGLAEEAKKSPRLRMNYNFHQSLQDKCHRFLNALEPGTFIPVHHHPDKDETFVILRGKVRVTTYNDEGEIVDSCVISQESGRYGVDIPKNVWHGLECLEPSVLLQSGERSLRCGYSQERLARAGMPGAERPVGVQGWTICRT